jgi:ubiquitin fusion degradation protein 1
MEEGGLLTVRNVSLAKATFIKLRAQSVDFLEVSNHRALLEVSLRKFTCLTVGDTICIPYSNRKFYLDIREVEPNGCASIIETDCNVDFEEPLGYKESKYGQFERDKEARDAAAALSKASSTAGSKVEMVCFFE